MSRINVVTACVHVCDFCGKRSDEVDKMVEGPWVRGDTVAICSECVALSAQLIAEDKEA